jgi:hypothetical protein
MSGPCFDQTGEQVARIMRSRFPVEQQTKTRSSERKGQSIQRKEQEKVSNSDPFKVD